jgi:hypothetical protein
MARILDAQRLAEAKHFPSEVAPPAEAPEPGGEPHSEVVSFIEVGGPVNGLHASADVLAIPAVFARKPRAATAPEMDSPDVPRTVLIEPQPLYVTLQPWPEAPAAPFPELICFHQPEHPASAAYRALLDRILGVERSTAPQAILFTGLTAGVGTTTALLNLAVSAARNGSRRVAVLDLNGSRPAVARRLGVSAGPWIDEVLAGRGGLEQALQPTGVPGLFILAPEVRGDQAVLPATEAIRWVISWLRPRFDLIIIDGPTWEDSPPFTSVDAVFLLAPADGPSAARVGHVSQAIARLGGRLRGILQTTLQS